MLEVERYPGRATPEGTLRFAQRFAHLPGHFRCPDRLHLSSLGLGLRGGDPRGRDELLYRTAVARLLEGGVNLFATGLSERMQMSERNLGAALARAFREGVVARDEVCVVTRGGYLTPDPDLAASPAQARRFLIETYLDSGLVDPDHLSGGVHCLDPPFLRDQIERSRRNLRLETLDLYLIEDPELALREAGAAEFRRRICAAFEELERAVRDGRIGAYGLSTWDGLLRPHSDRHHLGVVDLFGWALDVGGADHHLRALQLPYGLALPGALCDASQLGPRGRAEALLATLRGTGTAVLASAPLLQGRALGRLPDFVRESFPEARSDAQRCLQFARSTPGVTAALVGMREPGHVEENLGLARVPPAPPERIEALLARAARAGA
jgi:aryl-alcohol dehydrogenase-like predicted oxidoreductase